MKIHGLLKKNIRDEDNNIPFYVKSTIYTEELPVIYKVVRPSERDDVIKEFMNNVEIISKCKKHYMIKY